jgi:hypothetical protein
MGESRVSTEMTNAELAAVFRITVLTLHLFGDCFAQALLRAWQQDRMDAMLMRDAVESRRYGAGFAWGRGVNGAAVPRLVRGKRQA